MAAEEPWNSESADHLQRVRWSEDAGGDPVLDADGENQRRTGKAVRCELPFISVMTDPTTGGSQQASPCWGTSSYRSPGAHRIRRSARDRADDQAEASGGISEGRVPPGTRDGGYDRRADQAQTHADADSPVPGVSSREMRTGGESAARNGSARGSNAYSQRSRERDTPNAASGQFISQGRTGKGRPPALRTRSFAGCWRSPSACTRPLIC